MKKIFLISILLVFSCFNKTKLSELNEKTLIDNNWKIIINPFTEWEVKFSKNKKVNFKFSTYEDQGIFNGKYHINKEKVLQISTIKGHGSATYINLPKELKCKLIPMKNSLFYLEKLFCNNKLEIININKKVQDGMTRTFKNTKVVIKNTQMKATSNLKLRDMPNLKSKQITYIYGTKNDPVLLTKFLKRSYIKKDLTVKVIAKTVSKFKVKKWNNYWYYISIDSLTQTGPYHSAYSKTYGWVFGEFLK